MYSYDVGALPSGVVGLITGLAVLPWTLRANRLHPFFAAGLAASTFAFIYALLNPLLQPEHLSVQLLREEIANGHLALRTTSVIIGISFFLMYWRVSREAAPQWSGGTDPEEDYRHFLREMKRGSWTLDRALAQGVLFMIVLVGLWIFVITKHSSVLISLLRARNTIMGGPS